MLNILADVQCFQGKDPERGIPRWATGFVNSLKQENCRIIGLKNPRLPDLNSETSLLFDDVLDNTRTNVKTQLDVGRCVYVVLSTFEPIRPLSDLLPLHILDAKLPISVVIYDLTPYLFPQDYVKSTQDVQILNLKRDLFRYSDLFLCISQNTAKDLKNLWHIDIGRIVVVGTGISQYFHPIEEDENVFQKFGITRPYVFCVGRDDPRKRTYELIDVFSTLKRSMKNTPVQLVVTCHLSDETRNNWEKGARTLGLEYEDLVLTGAVSDEELRVLYSGCQLFVEPSIYEGFGYPAAEAAACGAVVLTSNTSSFPEVLRNPEAMFNPLDKSEMVALMLRAINDNEYRSRNRKISEQSIKLHTWGRVGAIAHEALALIAKSSVMPNRHLGSLMPITDIVKEEMTLRLKPDAVERFYSKFQFDEANENKEAGGS